MILVDSSVWVDHLRRGEEGLVNSLKEGEVLIHDLVIEELACGSLARRREFLGLLHSLPRAPWAAHSEFLHFVEMEGLHGKGIGAVDAHLLAAARLAGARLWTKDRALAGAAARLRLGVD